MQRLGGPNDPVLLDATLLGGQAFRWRPAGEGFTGVVGDAWYRLTRDPARAGAVLVRASPGAPPEERLREYLRLGDGYARALATLREDPTLAPAVTRYAGLRLLDQDPWETLAAFITSTNNHVARISTTLEGLARAAGARHEGPEGAYHAFPRPDAVAALEERDLRALGFGYRAPFLRGTALAVARGDVDLAHLRARASREDAREALVTLPGVGPKVADCVALFALGKTDAFPVDRWIARVVAERYFHGRTVKPADVAAFARERWGPLAGLAQQFIFHDARMSAPRRASTVAARPDAREGRTPSA